MTNRSLSPLNHHTTLELTATNYPIATQFHVPLSHSARECRTKLRCEAREPNSRIKPTFAKGPRARVEVGINCDTHLHTSARRIGEKVKVQARIGQTCDLNSPDEFGSPRKFKNLKRATKLTGQHWTCRWLRTSRDPSEQPAKGEEKNGTIKAHRALADA